jgi:putative tryptophan/tyrosine transport system substrate-binding protein
VKNFSRPTNMITTPASERIRHPVAVLVATGGTVSVLAAKAATTTIPIVFTTGGDRSPQGDTFD